MKDESLDSLDSFAWVQHFEKTHILRPGSFGRHQDFNPIRIGHKIYLDNRDPLPAIGSGILAREWVNRVRSQGMLAGQFLTGIPNTRLYLGNVHVEPATDSDLVNRQSGILTDESAFGVGNLDILQYCKENSGRSLVSGRLFASQT